MPFKDGDQDSYNDLMVMEDKEIKFWDKVNKLPNYMEPEQWEAIRADYHVRMAIAKAEGIENEKKALDDIFKRLELKDLKLIDKVKSTAEKMGAKHTVVVSHSQDTKKNPL